MAIYMFLLSLEPLPFVATCLNRIDSMNLIPIFDFSASRKLFPMRSTLSLIEAVRSTLLINSRRYDVQYCGHFSA